MSRAMTIINLAHSPRGHVVANAVQTARNPEMQVALGVQSGYVSSQLYLLADEARQLAHGLLEAADAYDRKCQVVALAEEYDAAQAGGEA